jgi:hypothetical protein
VPLLAGVEGCDDERSAAAVDVLAELGQRTQVLLFTHHEGVVETAQATLSADGLGVVRLDARDHGLPLVSAGGAEELVVDPSPRRKDNDPSNVQAVLEALRNAGQPLSKAQPVRGPVSPKQAGLRRFAPCSTGVGRAGGAETRTQIPVAAVRP